MLAAKVEKLLQHPPTDVIAAFKSIDKFYLSLESSPKSSLTSASFSRDLQKAQDKSVSKVIEAMTAVEESLSSYHANLLDTELHLKESLDKVSEFNNSESGRILHQMEALTQEQANLQSQVDSVSTLLTQYQLSESEILTLKVSDVQSPEFIQALQRAFDVKNASTSSFVDDVVALYDAGCKRCYDWLILTLESENADTLLVNNASTIGKLVNLLHNNHSIIEMIVKVRQNAIMKRWINSLTSGKSPIEMVAHDPRRYVSQIISWTVGTISSVREFSFELALNNDDNLLATTLEESVCNHVNGRVLQVINSNNQDLLLAYELVLIIAKSCSECLVVNNTIDFVEELKNSAIDHLKQTVLPTTAAVILQEEFDDDDDFTDFGYYNVPVEIEEKVNVMQDLLALSKKYGESTVVELNSYIIDSITKSIYSTITNAVTKTDDICKSSVYWLNNLSIIHAALRNRSTIEGDIKFHLKTLVDATVTTVLKECNIIINSSSRSNKEDHHITIEQLNALGNILQNVMLTTSLPLDRLSDHEMRLEAKYDFATSIASIYESSPHTDSCKYNVGQIKTLLEID